MPSFRKNIPKEMKMKEMYRHGTADPKPSSVPTQLPVQKQPHRFQVHPD